MRPGGRRNLGTWHLCKRKHKLYCCPRPKSTLFFPNPERLVLLWPFGLLSRVESAPTHREGPSRCQGPQKGRRVLQGSLSLGTDLTGLQYDSGGRCSKENRSYRSLSSSLWSPLTHTSPTGFSLKAGGQDTRSECTRNKSPHVKAPEGVPVGRREKVRKKKKKDPVSSRDTMT